MTWKTCLVCLHDGIVFSDTPGIHVKAPKDALSWLGRAGDTLKAKKCQLLQKCVGDLGHIMFLG